MILSIACMAEILALFVILHSRLQKIVHAGVVIVMNV